MSKLLRVYNPFSPSEVLHEYAPTSAAELDALLRECFDPATHEQLLRTALPITLAETMLLLETTLGWPAILAATEAFRIRKMITWNLEHTNPSGYPLGTGVIMPHETDPLATIVHLFAALQAGNQVILAPTPQTAAFTTNLVEIAQRADLPVEIAYIAPEDLPQALTHPGVAFVTWWGDSFTGFELAHELAAIAPGQRAPRRLWGQFDGNGVAVVYKDADLQRAARDIAQFAFTTVAASSFGIERVIVHADVHDAFLAELNAAADTFREFTPATTALAVRFAQFRQLAHYEGRVVRDEDDGVIVTDIKRSASTACEVVRGPFLTVQRSSIPEELIDLAGGGLYGSVAAVFGGDEAYVRRTIAWDVAGTVFHNEMRHAEPGEAAPVLKLSGIQTFPLGPELHRNYERAIAFLPNK